MDRTAWLIELTGNPPKWWSVSENDWTTDSLKAISFQKRHHAEGSIASDPVFAGAVATEHMWTALKPDTGECEHCKDYVGECPYCHRPRPKPDTGEKP